MVVRVVAVAAMVVVLAVAVIFVTVALAVAVFTFAPGIINQEREHSGCNDLIMAFRYRLTMKFPPGI
jgi:hypothetical protein